MEIFNKHYKSLLETFSEIQHYQRVVASNTKKHIDNLVNSKKNLEGLSDESKKTFGSSVSTFFFYSPYTGKATPYGAKRTSVDQAIEKTLFHKNKQYQWLLSDAYEAYEDYLEHMYACAGYVDHSFCQAQDFGEQIASSAKPLDYEWFLERLRNKRGATTKILGHFRKEFPNLVKLERSNKTGTDIRLSISLIEKIRHIVVHNNGRTGSREKVVNGVLKAACLLNNKKLEPAAREFINDYFGTGKHEGLVILVEKPVFNSGGISMTINRHDNLISDLLAHALIIRNELVSRFGV